MLFHYTEHNHIKTKTENVNRWAESESKRKVLSVRSARLCRFFQVENTIVQN